MPIDRVCLTKTTLIDYPGEVAAVVFTSGCNLRCPYCHNPELVKGPVPEEAITLAEFKAFLEKRKNVLGGVCITGGEPLIHDNLPDLIWMIQSRGLKVKLDTNGTFPERLKKLKPDYIAMDFKTAPEKYPILGLSNPENILKSIDIIIKSGIAHEFRVTAVPGIVDLGDIEVMADLISGSDLFVIAGFRPGVVLDPAFKDIAPYPEKSILAMAAAARQKGLEVKVRLNSI